MHSVSPWFGNFLRIFSIDVSASLNRRFSYSISAALNASPSRFGNGIAPSFFSDDFCDDDDENGFVVEVAAAAEALPLVVVVFFFFFFAASLLLVVVLLLMVVSSRCVLVDIMWCHGFRTSSQSPKKKTNHFSLSNPKYMRP